ncbi:MAG: thiamine phosphate synthase, partial [Victivallales bacterium]
PYVWKGRDASPQASAEERRVAENAPCLKERNNMETKTQRLTAFDSIDIYPVISSEFCAGRSPIYVLEQIAEGGARIVQLREKNKNGTDLIRLAREFRRICDRHGMLLIMNDNVGIAVETGADGVHLGQDDMPLADAREASSELILGCSTHSKEEALKAQADGADYINIGPIFATQTKTTGYNPLGMEILRAVPSLLRIPFTVMGGIKERHIPELVSLGAARIAMVTEITTADNIASKVRELRNRMAVRP